MVYRVTVWFPRVMASMLQEANSLPVRVFLRDMRDMCVVVCWTQQVGDQVEVVGEREAKALHSYTAVRQQQLSSDIFGESAYHFPIP